MKRLPAPPPATRKASSQKSAGSQLLSPETCAHFQLTKAEATVAALILEGLSYREIAARLGVSYHTVHDHIKALHRKANVSTSGKLAALLRNR